jgi:rubrerythrin
MGETENNLKAAFAGESQANRKYLAFARKADEEGYTGVAKLFRAAAEAETIHAHNHLDALKGVNSTLENLREAYGGEHYEFTEMYPVFLVKSKEEKQGVATKTFHYANEVEKIHGALYEDAIKQLENAGKFADRDYYVCRTCGYTIADKAPDKCPVCASQKDVFLKVS